MGGRFINRETQTVDNLSPPLSYNERSVAVADRDIDAERSIPISGRT